MSTILFGPRQLAKASLMQGCAEGEGLPWHDSVKVCLWPFATLARQLTLGNLAITPKGCCRASPRTQRPGHNVPLASVIQCGRCERGALDMGER